MQDAHAPLPMTGGTSAQRGRGLVQPSLEAHKSVQAGSVCGSSMDRACLALLLEQLHPAYSKTGLVAFIYETVCYRKTAL